MPLCWTFPSGQLLDIHLLVTRRYTQSCWVQPSSCREETSGPLHSQCLSQCLMLRRWSVTINWMNKCDFKSTSPDNPTELCFYDSCFYLFKCKLNLEIHGKCLFLFLDFDLWWILMLKSELCVLNANISSLWSGRSLHTSGSLEQTELGLGSSSET